MKPTLAVPLRKRFHLMFSRGEASAKAAERRKERDQLDHFTWLERAEQ
jgi:hypothetical protein